MDCLCVGTVINDLIKELFATIVRDAEDLEGVRRLRETTLLLMDLRDDVSRRVTRRELQGFRRTHEVESWLKAVGELDVQSKTVFMEALRGGTVCFWFFPDALIRRYRLQKAAEQLCEAAVQLCEQAEKFRIQSDLVVESKEAVDRKLPVPSSVVVGMEEILEEIRRSLSDKGDFSATGIVGVHGMAGAGKTTLLRSINNVIVSSGEEFDMVIWVTVSLHWTTDRLQWELANQLGIRPPDNKVDAAKLLCRGLSGKRFLIILDDVWEALDLQEIGIPDPVQSQSRILLTTRSMKVCYAMNAHRVIKVPLLSPDAAWELFGRKAGSEEILVEPEIQPYARLLVNLCSGLPIALVIAGRAMANERDASSWRHAVNSFRWRPDQMRGLPELLAMLKFSFDRLPDDVTRKCLLYCSLFPRDFDIDREQLIDCWLGEGFLCGGWGCGDIDTPRSRGHHLIDLLVGESLLLDGDSDPEGKVRMHGLVHHMAVWIDEKQEGLFFTRAGSGLTKLPRIPRRSNIRGVSLMGNEIGQLDPIGSCPQLSTLFLNHNEWISKLPEGFFSEMRALLVLNLSHTSITELPADIGLLVVLRYLNLSFTRLRSLPEELGNLLQLMQLDLSHTARNLRVPRRAISRLSRLQVLSMLGCEIEGKHDHDKSNEDDDRDREINLGDLEALENLQCLQVTVVSESSLEELLGRRSLRRATEVLHLVEDVSFKSTQPTSSSLRDMVNLRRLRIECCNQLRNVSWIMLLEGLVELSLRRCGGLEEVVAVGLDHEIEEQQVDTFPALPRLRRMRLENLPHLRNICPQVLAFPSLESLLVSRCPRLRRLTLGRSTAPRLREIRGEAKWWGSLEWDEESVRSDLMGKFFST